MQLIFLSGLHNTLSHNPVRLCVSDFNDNMQHLFQDNFFCPHVGQMDNISGLTAPSNIKQYSPLAGCCTMPFIIHNQLARCTVSLLTKH